MLNEIPFLGAGLGFRKELKEGILANPERVDFLELILDQYINKPPFKEQEACELARRFPLVIHGVDLSIGTDCAPDLTYLDHMQRLAELVDAKWVSDHLSITRVPGNTLGQLTPLSFNENLVDIVVRHIDTITKVIKRPFLVENISYYFTIPPTTLSEAEFITRVAENSGCYLLLDLTNLLNNSTNNGYDPFEFLDQIPLDRVVQIHLAGSSYHRNLWLDTHNRPVPPSVFELLQYAAPRMPQLKGVLIERDQDFPPIDELFGELDRAREILAEHSPPARDANLTAQV
jgi:uncharacterized protein (UPF0276 family)